MWQRHHYLIEAIGILVLLVFAFWAGMSPHWGYRYPLHVDEWYVLGYTQSTLEYSSLHYPNPFQYGAEVNFYPQMGSHLIVGFLKATTGLSWLELYRLAPGILVSLLAFLVYALCRRGGFGFTAALFVPLIPTSIRALGPTFIVPSSIALLLIPAILILLHNLELKGIVCSLGLILVMVGGTILIHPAIGGVATGLTLLYLVVIMLEFIVRRQYIIALGLLVAIVVQMVVPVILLVRWLPSLIKAALQQSVSIDPANVSLLGFNFGFFEAFGLIATVLFVLGVFLFSLDAKSGLRSYMLPAFATLLLVFLNFVYPRYRLGPDDLYERGWSSLGLFMAILAGYSIAYYFQHIPSLIQRIGNPAWARVILFTAGSALLVAAITTGIYNDKRQDYADYYHMMDDSVYADFVWLGECTVPGHKVVLMEPSIAWAYPSLAGPGNTTAGAASAPFTTDWVKQVLKMLATGSVETEWLDQQGANVVYARLPGGSTYTKFSNSDLIEVRPGVYLVISPEDR